MVLVLCEIAIRPGPGFETRVAVSISYDDNHYTTKSLRWWISPNREIPSLLVTLWVFTAGFASMASSKTSESSFFKPTWLCLIDKVLATQAKFLELPGNSSVINCAFHFSQIKMLLVTSVVYGPVIAQLKLVKQKFPNLTILRVLS